MKDDTGIHNAIMDSLGKSATFTLSSGCTFTGKVTDMTYFNKDDKQKQRPRMVIMASEEVEALADPDHCYDMTRVHSIDAIKIDAVSILTEVRPWNVESAKKK
jgi:hypothetical protein